MTTPSLQNPSDPLTPLMRQYNAIKAQNPDTVLLYRMGDFYEMFNEDAKIASKVLGLTLTARNHGGAEDVPLAGFPYHAIDRYANRLVKAGYKIAICEQTEDPKNAKGVVKRDIVEIITAGTATEDNFIEEKSNNFIVGVVSASDALGIAICDLSTGLFEAEQIPKDMLGEELVRIDPAEILLAGEEDNPLSADVKNVLPQALVSRYDAWKFEHDIADKYLCAHFGVATLSGFGFSAPGAPAAAVCAAGGLLAYLKEQKKNDLRHIVALSPRALSSFADLDPSTIRNLELLRPMHADDEDGTLLWVLDKTSTAMGARLLRTWITHPLRDIGAISERLDCVAWLKADVFVKGEAELFLRQIADIERLIGRVAYERANARDAAALAKSLAVFPRIVKLLSAAPSLSLVEAGTSLEGFDPLVESVLTTIVESPPLSIREG